MQEIIMWIGRVVSILFLVMAGRELWEGREAASANYWILLAIWLLLATTPIP